VFVHVPKQSTVKLVGSSNKVNHYIVIKKRFVINFPFSLLASWPGMCGNVMCVRGLLKNEKNKDLNRMKRAAMHQARLGATRTPHVPTKLTPTPEPFGPARRAQRSSGFQGGTQLSLCLFICNCIKNILGSCAYTQVASFEALSRKMGFRKETR